mgnify:CR=1 FL=1
MLVLFLSTLYAQGWAQATAAEPEINWVTANGGNSAEHARDFVTATDGSYLVVGYTRSSVLPNSDRNEESAIPRMDADLYAVKISSRGKVLWTKLFGGTYAEEAFDVALTREGGYAIAGFSSSKGLTNGDKDFYLVRTDMLGTKLWERNYGGPAAEIAHCVIPLPDGGYILAGSSTGEGGDISANRGGRDGWVIRVDADGELLWEKNYGGRLNDSFTAATLVNNNRVLLIGSTESTDFDAAGNNGRTDIFAVMMTLDKTTVWTKTLGGSANDEGHSVIKLRDGNLLLGGTTFSSDGDVTQNNGRGDVWVIKLTPQGRILWQRTYGGSKNEGANAVHETYEGNLLIGGTTSSDDGDLGNYFGLYDGWVVKTDEKGNIEWERNIGGSEKDEFYNVGEAASGDYIAVGYTASWDHDLTGVLREDASDLLIVSLKDPITEARAISLTPTVLTGYIRDTVNDKFVAAEVALVDNQQNKTIYTATSDAEFGIYQLLLPDTLELSIGVFAPGYFFHSENITISNLQRYAEIRKDIVLTPLEVGQKINLFNIHFDTGSDRLRKESRIELARVAEFLKQNPRIRLQINGHTDSTGNPATKKLLSERRAKAVKVYLMGLGIAPERLETKGFGMEKPIVEEDSDYHRQLNRRVELEVIE